MELLTLGPYGLDITPHVYPNGFAYPGTLQACGVHFRWIRLSYPPASPHRTKVRCRNVDLLSIDYAFRPRLRNRLTLRGRTFLRKP